VTTPRIDTRYVVTEFGAVNLKGLSSAERVHALVGLALPEYRLADLPTGSLTAVSCSEGPIWGMKTCSRSEG
jgi:Acetyl-CoA hydrolase/transferase C-terminal domain